MHSTRSTSRASLATGTVTRSLAYISTCSGLNACFLTAPHTRQCAVCTLLVCRCGTHRTIYLQNNDQVSLPSMYIVPAAHCVLAARKKDAALSYHLPALTVSSGWNGLNNAHVSRSPNALNVVSAARPSICTRENSSRRDPVANRCKRQVTTPVTSACRRPAKCHKRASIVAPGAINARCGAVPLTAPQGARHNQQVFNLCANNIRHLGESCAQAP
jgi:hypothetical protein